MKEPSRDDASLQKIAERTGCSLDANSSYKGINNVVTTPSCAKAARPDASTTFRTMDPKNCAATLRTMGVSSLQSWAKLDKSSLCWSAVNLGYADAIKDAADMRAVNHSFADNRMTISAYSFWKVEGGRLSATILALAQAASRTEDSSFCVRRETHSRVSNKEIEILQKITMRYSYQLSIVIPEVATSSERGLDRRHV